MELSALYFWIGVLFEKLWLLPLCWCSSVRTFGGGLVIVLGRTAMCVLVVVIGCTANGVLVVVVGCTANGVLVVVIGGQCRCALV